MSEQKEKRETIAREKWGRGVARERRERRRQRPKACLSICDLHVPEWRIMVQERDEALGHAGQSGNIGFALKARGNWEIFK